MGGEILPVMGLISPTVLLVPIKILNQYSKAVTLIIVVKLYIKTMYPTTLKIVINVLVYLARFLGRDRMR